jgi:hypothetical protein
MRMPLVLRVPPVLERAMPVLRVPLLLEHASPGVRIVKLAARWPPTLMNAVSGRPVGCRAASYMLVCLVGVCDVCVGRIATPWTMPAVPSLPRISSLLPSIFTSHTSLYMTCSICSIINYFLSCNHL